MSVRAIGPAAAALAAVLLGGGCLGGLGGDSAPAVRTYALSGPGPAASGRGRGALSIAVEELHADAPYDQRRIVYRASRYRVDYYDDDSWVAAPGVMVADSLRRAYQSSGRFAMVLSEPAADTAAILGGRVVAFDEVDEGARRVAHLAVELELRDAETGRMLWSRRAEERIAMTAATRDALAAALSKAVARLAAATAGEIAAAAH
jgi:ABC-type uncharacterized transport system auxiliary subunit